jgi:hypothetical protein
MQDEALLRVAPVSALKGASRVVVDCIYGVACGPRCGSGSRNRRTDGQLGT